MEPQHTVSTDSEGFLLIEEECLPNTGTLSKSLEYTLQRVKHLSLVTCEGMGQRGLTSKGLYHARG